MKRKSTGLISGSRGAAKEIIIDGRRVSQHTLKKAATSLMGNYRKLTFDPRIQQENPDKVFRWINLKEWQNNNGSHPYGYQPYSDLEDRIKGNKNLSSKNYLDTNINSKDYIIRENMVLAWIPREDYEIRRLRSLAASSTSLDSLTSAYKASMPAGMGKTASIEEGSEELINAADVTFGGGGSA
jgi:hypothetical protein